jgi:hypothetical protein
MSKRVKGTDTPMTYTRFRRLATLTLAAAVVAAAIAACGSSTTSTTTAGAAAASTGAATSGGPAGLDRSKLVSCLKAHGVTLPARPAGAHHPAGGSGGRQGFFFGGGGGAGSRFANNPKLRAAFAACGGGRGFRGHRFTLDHAAVAKFVACVKQHGYNLPAPNFSGRGPIFPAGIEHNSKFQAAARACQADLRPAGAPAPGGPPGGVTATTSGA